MESFNWINRPQLDDPVVIAAFAGWNDAGEAATGAVRYLASQWNATEFVQLDSEDFYDFSISRPLIRLHDGVSRDIEWPVNRFLAARAPGDGANGENDRDIILLLGVEPQLKWRTFCSSVLEFAEQMGASALITLGSMLADVPHTRIPQLHGSASSSLVFKHLGVKPSQYEGPTGIIGALQQSATVANFPAASLWVSVPHYVGHLTSPKATLSLVEHITEMLSVSVQTEGLRAATAFYDEQVEEALGSDDELRNYIVQLEEAEDDEEDNGDKLAAEVEQFLREQGS